MPATVVERPYVRGKFLFLGDEKFYICGVTYGTFRRDEAGQEIYDPAVVEHDFAMMAVNGVNAVRTYTVPPHWLLDAAARHGLYVMVGLLWDQYIAFLDDDKTRARAIEERVREGVRACAGHPAVLCYAIGNEIPAPLVRWYGHRRIERFLKRLYRVVKAADPEGLVTYVNYPSTEYLELPFVDLLCFNVYLESQENLAAYLARLQNLAGDRPLVLAEMGLDSRRNGEEGQARTLDWQIRTAFAAGCAGTFVFAWTDEWFVNNHDIQDWEFGLTTRERQPKQALATVRQAYGYAPFPPDLSFPRISVVVCSYNGQRTVRDCLEGMLQLDYPNFEVIVVDDGSTDRTADIARDLGFTVISTENRGLSHARNTGLAAATGEIVAYVDDDARPDPHWLSYLAATFLTTHHAGVGGPNIAPFGDGPIADCVANAPGGPIHILLTDQEAEHIPGCNMALRADCLRAIGGFDPQFRIAGDDVDVCWRLQQRGWTLGFNPAAVVWHHRRNSVRTFWKQQKNYGRAEALLEKKWPEKANGLGHLRWSGRLYGRGLTVPLGLFKRQIYQGMWGSAPFQSLYQPAPNTLGQLLLMPEWYLVILALAMLALLGLLWTPLFLALPLFALALGAVVIQAGLSAAHASFPGAPRTRWIQLKLQGLTAVLHMLQPLARLYGRLGQQLIPRSRGSAGYAWLRPHRYAFWSEQWEDPMARLHALEADVKAQDLAVCRGGEYDRWDLEIRGGLFGKARLLMAIEEHGEGKQLVRFRVWPVCSVGGLVLLLLFALLSSGAVLDHGWTAALLLGTLAFLLAFAMFAQCAGALVTFRRVVKQPQPAMYLLSNRSPEHLEAAGERT
jgi:GT2 family glycosyltransferase